MASWKLFIQVAVARQVFRHRSEVTMALAESPNALQFIQCDGLYQGVSTLSAADAADQNSCFQ